MTTPDTLKAALDKMLAADDPDEKAQLRAAFARLVRDAWGRTRPAGERDWAKLAAADHDDTEDA